jgi:adenosylcobinamide kinase / adenosylcobinamide-phosphate guanylyltransferase
MKELILGGTRSGKSRLAERHAQHSGLPVTYIATARDSADDEFRARIAAHRGRRDPAWVTLEEPISLGAALRRQAVRRSCVIVDCLTLWLTNLLCAGDEAQFVRERDSLLEALPELPGRLILVASETGLGVVPLGALSRRFVDESGLLHQAAAQLCDRVILTVAGLPLYLKGVADAS